MQEAIHPITMAPRVVSRNLNIRHVCSSRWVECKLPLVGQGNRYTKILYDDLPAIRCGINHEYHDGNSAKVYKERVDD